MRVFSLRWNFNHGVVVQPRGFLGVDETEFTDPGVGARHGSGEKVSSEKTLASVRATDGDNLVRMCQSSLIFGVDARCRIERGGATNGPRRRCCRGPRELV